MSDDRGAAMRARVAQEIEALIKPDSGTEDSAAWLANSARRGAFKEAAAVARSAAGSGQLGDIVAGLSGVTMTAEVWPCDHDGFYQATVVDVVRIDDRLPREFHPTTTTCMEVAAYMMPRALSPVSPSPSVGR